MSLRLHYAIRSDVGHVREGNEDSAYAGPYLLAVADGMGGHAAGEVASSTVVSALAELDTETDADEVLEALVAAMHEANAQLRAMSARDGTLDGMGTTVTALLASGDQLGVLHVGDSRCYLLRDEVLSQVTHDHTLVQDLVDQGRITPEQANTHPQRSLLMRALDGREVEPDLSMRQAQLGDRYLLCTDGLSGVVSGETILEALLGTSPRDAVDRLVELALKGGGPDNITVVVADVVDDEEPLDEATVAGAAAEKGSVPGATAARVGPNPRNPDTDSAAAKAARIGKGSPRGGLSADDFAEGSERRGGRRVVFIGATVVVLLVVTAVVGWTWMRNQYYVGVRDDKVAILQGVPSLGSLAKSHKIFDDLPLSSVAQDQRDALRDGIGADDLADAEKIVADLKLIDTDEVIPGEATRPSPSPSLTPSPTPTLGPSGIPSTAAAPANP
ncbi:serine/threonine-protein phosphatase [Frankia sp. CNm7]|uniref:Serine/threonine protein phosphatase PstP n=1 Tax=Frankia nepalensis TaxID=1836974 RepID=A0A937R7C6_9ACTN|nr:PP2C family serine/threonine-protein phosphatase [Frankia nepalensis]MBL7494892.1 serine/threonine-protein phosphatase [Frankia nepalensis]MBL7515647.1 serine/threonine-protein phosphatase [Frankia nepalensis]MBL7521183.1 serine/threonine-protein phosphatase [Frankia nepalensis]MBL7626661.1 serine/threonine-protein phosphatase [Frankia nepalensis]